MSERQFYRYLAAKADAGRLEVKHNHPLSESCTFNIGGNAACAVYPTTAAEVTDIIKEANECGEKYVVLGNGSNILIDDGFFDGTIIFTTKMNSITLCGENMTAECGVSLTKLSVTAQKNSLSGLEFAYGIPGTVGGAVYMNAGAYGGEISYIVASSKVYNPADGTIRQITTNEHGFSYRKSIFSYSKEIVLSTEFKLSRGNPSEIKAKMDEYMSGRNAKQPLDYPSAGSVFKRCGELFTAKLIDQAGLKGRAVGDARVSEKHAGFIINGGKATAADVLALIKIIKDTIYQLNGVKIECEIRFLSFEKGKIEVI